MILTELTVDAETFEAATGWAVKPEGACKGDVCVPLDDEVVTSDGIGDGIGDGIDAAALAERLGMPLVHDRDAGLWSLGPDSAVTGRALTTALASDDWRVGKRLHCSTRSRWSNCPPVARTEQSCGWSFVSPTLVVPKRAVTRWR